MLEWVAIFSSRGWFFPRGGWRENRMKVVKRYELSLIRSINRMDVVYSMINASRIAVCDI